MKTFGKAVILVFLVLGLTGCGNMEASHSINSDNDGYTDWTPEMSAPANLQAVVSDGSVVLSWDAVDGAEYYNVYWSCRGTEGTATGAISTSGQTFVHRIPEGASVLHYTVTSVNQFEESLRDNTIVVRTGETIPEPGPDGQGGATPGPDGGITEPDPGTAGGSNTIPANPADPGVRPAIPALPNQANGNPGGPGGEEPPELCPDGTYAPCPSEPSGMIVRTKSGLVRVSETGSIQTFNSAITGSIEVRNGRLYALHGDAIVELDSSGNIISTIEIPSQAIYFINFTALPGGGFALLDNRYDKIYFMDDSGNYLRSVNIKNTYDNHLQNVHGVVVDNRLIVSEDGDRRLLAVDLNSYTVTVFRDFSDTFSTWLNVIIYNNGAYYLSTPSKIYTFTETGSTSLFADIHEGNITGVLINSDGYAYVTINFSGNLYRVSMATGEHELFTSGLNYPRDIVAF